MHILGLSNGSIDGNSETILKAALTAAKGADLTITSSFVHVPSVSIPHNAPPLNAGADLTNGLYDRKWGRVQDVPDDRKALLDAILDADALIFASPVYSHQPAGTLKAVMDSILGPFADAAFAKRIAKGQEEGDPKFLKMNFDPRVLRPRVAAFMIVCGSDDSIPDQWTMALPTMHLFTYPLHAKVVDQFVAPGCNYPGAVLLKDGAYMARAEQLGQNVASQMGKAFDEAKYLGQEEEAACPYCHLLKFEFCDASPQNRVRCITCGAEGVLETASNGRIRPTWEQDSQISSLTMAGKTKHLDDIFGGVEKTRPKMMVEEVQKLRAYWKDVSLNVTELPSNTAETELAAKMKSAQL
jgi:multimeric flavodoxin WrbA